MKPLDVGRLNKRITFLQYEEAQDELGQDCQKLTEFASVWATVMPARGTEPREADKIQPKQTYVVTIRYRPGITTEMLIRYAGKILEIESAVDVEEAHYKIELQCVERKGADKNDDDTENIRSAGAKR